VPMFRQSMKVPSTALIDVLEAVSTEASGEEAVAEIFAAVDTDRKQAAAKAYGYLAKGGSSDLFFAAARRMIFHKGRDSHEYKYGAAAWEECELASDPKWQPALAAATLAYLPGSGKEDSPLMKRAQDAVARVSRG
jgi:hypothetical protein